MATNYTCGLLSTKKLIRLPLLEKGKPGFTFAICYNGASQFENKGVPSNAAKQCTEH
jgi:hypothetical protein